MRSDLLIAIPLRGSEKARLPVMSFAWLIIELFRFQLAADLMAPVFSFFMSLSVTAHLARMEFPD
jgi:hypothetical protein